MSAILDSQSSMAAAAIINTVEKMVTLGTVNATVTKDSSGFWVLADVAEPMKLSMELPVNAFLDT